MGIYFTPENINAKQSIEISSSAMKCSKTSIIQDENIITNISNMKNDNNIN
jgi:hypothetical protein